MPEKLKARLIKTAKSKFPKNKKRQDAYVYGTLHKTGTQEGSVITRRRKRKAREILENNLGSLRNSLKAD